MGQGTLGLPRALATPHRNKARVRCMLRAHWVSRAGFVCSLAVTSIPLIISKSSSSLSTIISNLPPNCNYCRCHLVVVSSFFFFSDLMTPPTTHHPNDLLCIPQPI